MDALSLLSAASSRRAPASAAGASLLRHNRVNHDCLPTHDSANRAPLAASDSVLDTGVPFRHLSCGPWWDAWNVERLCRIGGGSNCAALALSVAYASSVSALPLQRQPIRSYLPSLAQLTTTICNGQSVCSIFTLPLFISPRELVADVTHSLDFLVFARRLLACSMAALTGTASKFTLVAERCDQPKWRIDINHDIDDDRGQQFVALIEQDAVVTSGVLKCSVVLGIGSRQSSSSNRSVNGRGDDDEITSAAGRSSGDEWRPLSLLEFVIEPLESGALRASTSASPLLSMQVRVQPMTHADTDIATATCAASIVRSAIVRRLSALALSVNVRASFAAEGGDVFDVERRAGVCGEMHAAPVTQCSQLLSAFIAPREWRCVLIDQHLPAALSHLRCLHAALESVHHSRTWLHAQVARASASAECCAFPSQSSDRRLSHSWIAQIESNIAIFAALRHQALLPV